jgi:hypothetical protein
LSNTNVWKVERVLLEHPHRPIKSSDRRIDRLRQRYVEHMRRTGNRKPVYYDRRERWTPIPGEFAEV